MSDEKRVIIIGSGPSGLAAAIELGSRGIPCVVLEREPRAGYAPRAKTTHTRTREHLRRWGIADRLAQASPFGIDYPSDVLFVTRLSGMLVHRFENAFDCSPVQHEHYSEHGQWVPQYKLEAVLREHVLSLGLVQIRYGHMFEKYHESATDICVGVRSVEDGREYALEGAFLIGADGARSAVRDAIGATMIGSYGLSRNYNTIFRARGLAKAHSHGPGVMYVQLSGDTPGLIGPMDQDDLWYFMPTALPPDRTFTQPEAVAAIRRSTGIDLPYEILSSDEWVASRLIADRYSRGRVYLIGDACHLHPPFGGFGMNMGIADGVDLGWKMAAVLKGWGGPALLESYEVERRQAHEHVLDESQANHAAAPNGFDCPGLEDDTPHGAAMRAAVRERIIRDKTAEFHARGVVLGGCYRGSPVIVDDGTAADSARSIVYTPSASPGCLAPHRWMTDEVSLYDLFGHGFTLLVLAADADVEAEVASQAARDSGTPLQVLRLHHPELREMYGAPLVLIRPDQYVAWRGQAWPSDLLHRVTGRA